jgi:flagellar assembly protein FliH
MSSKIIRGDSTESRMIGDFTLSYATHSEVVVPVYETSTPVSRQSESHPVASEIQQQIQNQLEQARREAELLIQRAQTQASTIEKEAYERGFQEGERAGKEIGEKMSEAILKQYSGRLEELSQLRKQILSNSEKEVVRLSLEIAKRVVKREINIDDELILTMVKVALNRLAEQTAVIIRLNPKDYQTIMTQQSSNSVLGGGMEGIRLIEDPLISRGGALIETESGTIDARIEEQFREIERGMFS